MSEEMLRKAKKVKEESDKIFAECKGMLKGYRMGGKQTAIDEAFLKTLELIMNGLKILELIMNGFKNLKDNTFSLSEISILMYERISNLEKKTRELEESINQLRSTWDKLSELRLP